MVGWQDERDGRNRLRIPMRMEYGKVESRIPTLSVVEPADDGRSAWNVGILPDVYDPADGGDHSSISTDARNVAPP